MFNLKNEYPLELYKWQFVYRVYIRAFRRNIFVFYVENYKYGDCTIENSWSLECVKTGYIYN